MGQMACFLIHLPWTDHSFIHSFNRGLLKPFYASDPVAPSEIFYTEWFSPLVFASTLRGQTMLLNRNSPLCPVHLQVPNGLHCQALFIAVKQGRLWEIEIFHFFSWLHPYPKNPLELLLREYPSWGMTRVFLLQGLCAILLGSQEEWKIFTRLYWWLEIQCNSGGGIDWGGSTPALLPGDPRHTTKAVPSP